MYGYVHSNVGELKLIELEDFYSGMERSLLLRLEVEPEKEGDITLGELRLTYNDVIKKQPVNIVKTLQVSATNRDAYASGALAAARFLVDQPAGWYGMNDVLGF